MFFMSGQQKRMNETDLLTKKHSPYNIFYEKYGVSPNLFVILQRSSEQKTYSALHSHSPPRTKKPRLQQMSVSA